MRLNAPKKTTWIIAVIVGLLGFIANFVTIPFVSDYVFWFLSVAFILLALATYLKGL
jgi:hypothetical protein